MSSDQTMGTSLTPNYAQTTGAIERLITAALVYSVGRGWILPTDVVPLGAVILAGLSAAYAIYVNRATNLAKQAASISPGTVVITTPEIAAATPGLPNIVSNQDIKAVPK